MPDYWAATGGCPYFFTIIQRADLVSQYRLIFVTLVLEQQGSSGAKVEET
ncbi:hypothetical protein L6R29_00025 [Myxococcota bacterium]|nr:hypothetical protein [Myxococcota bacterium]